MVGSWITSACVHLSWTQTGSGALHLLHSSPHLPTPGLHLEGDRTRQRKRHHQTGRGQITDVLQSINRFDIVDQNRKSSEARGSVLSQQRSFYLLFLSSRIIVSKALITKYQQKSNFQWTLAFNANFFSVSSVTQHGLVVLLQCLGSSLSVQRSRVFSLFSKKIRSYRCYLSKASDDTWVARSYEGGSVHGSDASCYWTSTTVLFPRYQPDWQFQSCFLN